MDDNDEVSLPKKPKGYLGFFYITSHLFFGLLGGIVVKGFSVDWLVQSKLFMINFSLLTIIIGVISLYSMFLFFKYLKLSVNESRKSE